MTHRSDCRVVDEWRDTVNEIADLFQNGNADEAKDRLEDMGWEHLGSGIARSVWRVPSAAQLPPRADDDDRGPVLGADCVVKFAMGPGEGTFQNSQEVSAYLDFPESIKEADPPVVAPVKDWDDDYLLTARESRPLGRE